MQMIFIAFYKIYACFLCLVTNYVFNNRKMNVPFLDILGQLFMNTSQYQTNITKMTECLALPLPVDNAACFNATNHAPWSSLRK